MKKQLLKPMILCSAVITVLAFSACGKDTKDTPKTDDRKWPDTVTYSNLNDQASRELLTDLMTDAGVTLAKQKVLFDHIDQINDVLTPDLLTDGFETLSIQETKYDPYKLQDNWMEKYPDFLGYNCRISAYTAFSDFIAADSNAKADNSLLMMDLDALDIDKSAVPDGTDKFEQFFSAVPTKNTSDPQKHLRILQKDQAKRGIKFKSNDKMSLISVVLHDQIDEDRLFTGHVGVLFPAEDGNLYFLEKIAFQEPYQLCRFSNRSELSDYLMKKYDTEFNQTAASPLVLENDQLIEGYRVVDKK